MEDQESGALLNSTMTLRESQCSLLLTAAAVLRRRYVHRVGDANVSPTAADELARILEAIAGNRPPFDKVDQKEAIALAHRLIDDDHPEHSRMWPTKSAG